MNFSRPGAIDLSALKQPPARPGQPAAGGGSYVVDITEQNFQSAALEASMNYIVILSLWSPRSPQSESFNALLGSVVSTYGGQLVLAQVDIDANPTIAQALQAQAVPLVVGLVKGQPVPLFQGTVDEAEARRYFDELINVAAQNGVTGRAQAAGATGATDEAAEEPEQPEDPRFAAADEAFAASDFDTAVAEYEKLQAQYPADTEVSERLAGVKLLARTQGVDLQAARKAAADAPDDLDAQMLVADLDVSGGHVDDAFDRLIGLVKRTSEDDRERVRERLLELFTVVGVADPRVATARRALASALF
jgi:putative thioredoxin